MRIAASRASPSCENAFVWSASTPPISARAPLGRSASASARVTVADAAVRSSVEGVTVTVAVRRPRWVVIEAGPSLSPTVAMASNRIGPAAVGTSRARSSSRVVGGSETARYTVSEVPSISTVPT